MVHQLATTGTGTAGVGGVQLHSHIEFLRSPFPASVSAVHVKLCKCCTAEVVTLLQEYADLMANIIDDMSESDIFVIQVEYILFGFMIAV